MPAMTPPYIRMSMVVPVPCRLLDRFDHLCPGLKTASFEGQGAERVPPRLDAVEIGCILWLKDKVPPLVLQTKQQDIGCTMDMQIVNNGVESLALCGAPPLDVTQAVHPIMD